MADPTAENAAFWKTVAADHREAFVEVENEAERLRAGLRLIAECPFGAEVHELRAIAAAALSGAPGGES